MTLIAWLCAVALGMCALSLLVALSPDLVRPQGARPAGRCLKDGPLVSVLVPAYNEQDVISSCVRGILASEYRALEVIVVDDGSKDRTSAIVGELSQEDRRLRAVCHIRNLGKAAALNTGIADARSELIVVIDADTAPHPQFIGRMVQPLLEQLADAVAGNVKVAARPGWITALQRIEYVACFNSTRLFQGRQGSITTIPGAAGAMRRTALLAMGGYSGDTKAEDADLTLRMMHGRLSVQYLREAIVYTEVPLSWRALLHQRIRWLYGNLQCMLRHLRRQPARPMPLSGFPLFAYENLMKPPVELLRAGIPVLVGAGWISLYFLYGYLVLLMLHVTSVIRSFAHEGEQPPSLLLIVAHYLLWPLFTICPFLVAVCKFITHTPISWRKVSPDLSPRRRRIRQIHRTIAR
jgi:cellulose synthase/poly-beta-1,6-N-acetylglucosamine synthase-like glycosyltransferase